MVVPLRFRWQDVLFINHPIDPERLRPLVPEALRIDTARSQAWVSVVPFVNRALRPQGVPGRFGIRLPELNVRTYVRHDGTPGIYFFSLDADGLASVLGARLTHHLPYFFADISVGRDGEERTFVCRRRHPGARHAVFRGRYGPDGPRFLATERPLPEFLLERYRLYTVDTRGRLRYTEVSHPTWPVAPAEATVAADSVRAAAGIPHGEAEPILYFSRGVDVRAARSRRV